MSRQGAALPPLNKGGDGRTAKRRESSATQEVNRAAPTIGEVPLRVVVAGRDASPSQGRGLEAQCNEGRETEEGREAMRTRDAQKLAMRR